MPTRHDSATLESERTPQRVSSDDETDSDECQREAATGPSHIGHDTSANGLVTTNPAMPACFWGVHVSFFPRPDRTPAPLHVGRHYR